MQMHSLMMKQFTQCRYYGRQIHTSLNRGADPLPLFLKLNQQQQQQPFKKKQVSRRLKLFINDTMRNIENERAILCARFKITPIYFQLAFTQFSNRFNQELIYHKQIQKLFEDNMKKKDRGILLQESATEIMAKLFWQDYQERHLVSQTTQEISVEKQKELRSITKLTKPHEWFPETRNMKRKIVLHIGSRSSGYEENTFDILRKTASGIYCSASTSKVRQYYVNFTKHGIPASYTTDSRRLKKPDTRIHCSTIEHVDTDLCIDTAVIDDAHLMADSQRGWAWTRAILGINAKEIHICGDDRIATLVDQMCRDTHDEVSYHNYINTMPLNITKYSRVDNDYSNIDIGDCIIAFTRRDLFDIKRKIEKRTGLSVCLVYDDMPPAIILEQIRLFNHPKEGYEVLVTTDTCFSTTTDLNVQRVVFHSINKYDQNSRDYRQLPLNEVINIASAFSGIFISGGEIAFLKRSHYDVIKKESKNHKLKPSIDLKAAGISPSHSIIEQFANEYYPDQPLPIVLDALYKMLKTERKYFICNNDRQLTVAEMLEQVRRLSLSDKLIFTQAPVKIQSPTAMKILKDYAMHHSKNEIVPLIVQVPNRPPVTLDELRYIETGYKLLDVYLYLSYKFPKTFKHRETARSSQKKIIQMIDVVLSRPTTRSFLSPRHYMEDMMEDTWFNEYEEDDSDFDEYEMSGFF
jgi:ATP-dependent RNA helicase SUPV3L1/SUV3